MDRRSFMQIAAMLAAAHGLPGVTFAAGRPSFSSGIPLAVDAAAEECRLDAPPENKWSPFEIVDEGPRLLVFKVVGVGGVGCHVVERMIREEIADVTYVCLDRDFDHRRESLLSSDGIAHVRTIECRALSGEVTDPGKSAALARIERGLISANLEGADMVIIVAGMGGVFGTHVAPVVAEIACELGVAPVAMVTQPSESDTETRRLAEEGLARLAQFVDSPIVLSNDAIRDELGENASIPEVYQQAVNLLQIAVKSIPDTLWSELTGVDYSDVRTMLDQRGKGMMACATVNRDQPAGMAAQQAANSFLLGSGNLSNANGVLVNITGDTSLNWREILEIMSTLMEWVKKDAIFIVGTTFDHSMVDALRVTIIATGIGSNHNEQNT